MYHELLSYIIPGGSGSGLGLGLGQAAGGVPHVPRAPVLHHPRCVEGTHLLTLTPDPALWQS